MQKVLLILLFFINPLFSSENKPAKIQDIYQKYPLRNTKKNFHIQPLETGINLSNFKKQGFKIGSYNNNRKILSMKKRDHIFKLSGINEIIPLNLDQLEKDIFFFKMKKLSFSLILKKYSFMKGQYELYKNFKKILRRKN